MKKTILAIAITGLFATTAQAANLYSADGTSVSMAGEVDAIFTTVDVADDAADEDGKIYTWANVQFDIVTKVSDSVNALASFEVEANNGEEVKVDDAWIGFTGDFGTVKFGETGSSYALLEKTELVNEGDDYDVAYSDSENDGRAVRYQKTLGPVALSANYSFVEGNSDVDDNFALSADYSVDMFTIGAAYLNGGDDISSMGVSASMDMGALYAAATYTVNTVTADSAYDFDTAALSASYALGEIASVYGSYQIQDGDNKDISNIYVGVSRDIAANVYAFVEYIVLEDDSVDTDTMFAGIYYAF